MNDTYVEVMVARKKLPVLGVLRVLLYILAAVCFILSIFSQTMVTNLVCLAGTVAFGAVAWLVIPRFDIEYEYLYLDKEITIDKIMSREKRRNVFTVDLNKMEFMARRTSHELDSYKARNLKVYDFSSREEGANVYSIVYSVGGEGTVLVDIEPNEEMLHAIRTVFPRKVIDI